MKLNMMGTAKRPQKGKHYELYLNGLVSAEMYTDGMGYHLLVYCVDTLRLLHLPRPLPSSSAPLTKTVAANSTMHCAQCF